MTTAGLASSYKKVVILYPKFQFQLPICRQIKFFQNYIMRVNTILKVLADKSYNNDE